MINESPTKSCLLDPIPTFLLKECVDILLPSITKLINMSLSEGCFPDSFKKAIVTPLIKKSCLPSDELKNYRPVSGLCFVSKLVERAVSNQLKSHIRLNELDNPLQSAYKAGHSTESALLYIKNEVHVSLSKGMPTALVLLDLSAAFDTIDHDTLTDCLASWFGLGGTVIDWFTSYLKDRCQAIKVGSTLSDLRKLLFGVPQGSVLGPLLFSLYTTPLSKIIGNHPNIKFHFYADDTQLFIHLCPKSASSMFAKLNSCLSDVQKWMSSCKLKLNPDKTEFIVFGSPAQHAKLNPLFPINILGNPLHPAQKVKNLGVWFDADFTFTDHVSNVCRNSFLQLRDLRRIRKYLSVEQTILVANALVSSPLDYCNSLFRSLSCTNLRRLQCIQNTLARIVTNHRRFTRASPILKSLHWLPVKYRSMFKVATFVYKFLTYNHPCYFSSSFVPYNCNYNTRRSRTDKKFLITPQYNPPEHRSKKQFNYTLAFDAAAIWNNLPENIRTAPSCTSFRKRLKSHFFDMAFPP